MRWWKETVSVRHGLNRHSVESADRGTLAMPDAESMTGITKQQVSRWRKKLQKREDYRIQLLGAAAILRRWRSTTGQRATSGKEGVAQTSETLGGRSIKNAMSDFPARSQQPKPGGQENEISRKDRVIPLPVTSKVEITLSP